MATIQDIAKECGIDIEIVRRILTEDSTLRIKKENQDKIFQTARKMGYDFKKLKLGKRMDNRKETVDEILEKIVVNHEWDRVEIIKYLKSLTGLVDRVHKRAFPDEFGEE